MAFNAANLAMFVGILFSVIPAMGLMYVMLNRYEGFFDEKRLFKYLLVGLIAGAVITLLEILAFRFHEPLRIEAGPMRTGLVLLLATYPLLEAAAMTVVLNWQTLAGRRDTPYYATSFGLGFGAIGAFIVVARAFVQFLQSDVASALSHAEILFFSALLFLLFVGGVMTHAVAGALIGEATARRSAFVGLLYGASVLIPYYVGYYAFWSTPHVWLRFAAPSLVFLYGLFVVRYVIRKVLDEVVPEDLAKEVRRAMRKKARESGSP